MLKRSNLQNFRIILLTSLFWVFIDAFLIIYLADTKSSSDLIQSCEKSISELKLKLIKQQQKQQDRQTADGGAQKQQQEYDDILKVRNGDRFKDVHDLKDKGVNGKKVVKEEKKSSTEASFINKIKQWFREDGDEERNPSNWPGEGGKAVVLSAVAREEAKKRFKENQFNIVASDMVAINRSLADQRSAK